jgi:hypothetical protein
VQQRRLFHLREHGYRYRIEYTTETLRALPRLMAPRDITPTPLVASSAQAVRDALSRWGAIPYSLADPMQREREGICHRRLRDDIEFETKMHDGLGDLRSDTAPIQPSRRHRLDEVLRHERVDSGHAGNVDDRDLRTSGNDTLK